MAGAPQWAGSQQDPSPDQQPAEAGDGAVGVIPQPGIDSPGMVMGITLGELYTDNLGLAGRGEPKRSSWITEVQPFFKWARSGPRFVGLVDYTLTGYQYAGQSHTSQLAHDLHARGTFALLPQHLFIDGQASYGREVINNQLPSGRHRQTLLIQKLFEEIAHRNIAMAGIASANLDGEDILPAVASAFALPYDGRGKEALLQDLKQHLTNLRERHSHALLVVDEAQTLTAAALEMLRILSNYEIDGRALLQVFLVGQAELQRTIVDHRMEQLRQRIIASHRLEPMGAEECREYILHRLRAVGWDNDPELAPGIFAGVCGRPRHSAQGQPHHGPAVPARLPGGTAQS
ncbi:AAA family ATPase [Rhodanobacter lindaniclasticus]